MIHPSVVPRLPPAAGLKLFRATLDGTPYLSACPRLYAHPAGQTHATFLSHLNGKIIVIPFAKIVWPSSQTWMLI